MDNSRKAISGMGSSIKSTLISVLVGEIITIFWLFICSILMTNLDIPLGLTDILVIVSATLGGLTAGYCNGRMQKEKGLLNGAFSGGIMVLILILFNVIFNGFTSTGLTFLKLILVMALAMIGSVLGVNKKSKRIKY